MPKARDRRARGPVYGPLSFLNDRAIDPTYQQADRLMRQRMEIAQNLYRRDLKAHYGCVNAIEFSNCGGNFIASGGDDRRVLLWNTQNALSNIGKPQYMRGEHNSNIFCLAFDADNKKIFSGGNDEQVIVHDLNTGESLDVFMHEDAVYGLSVDPNNVNVFASACDDGRVQLFDIRESPSTDPFCLANYTSSMHAVMYNPVDPRLLATANAKEGIGLWDIRKPKTCLLRYGGGFVQQSCMSVRINRNGDQVLALRRRLPPVLYNLHSPQPVCEFDHSGYYNSCTMKSCSFAGDKDQYVLSGSDDFNLYMWKIPENLTKRQYVNDAHMVLKGHRSIVNQVRFNPSNHLIISSGVEKIVKVWSPFQMTGCKGGLECEASPKTVERPVFTHEEYISLVLRSGHVMTHDYSSHSMEEDPRMMAFFDSLVQRELEGFSSDDDLSGSEQELYERIVQLSRSDLSSDNSDSEPGQEAENREMGNNSASDDNNADDDSSFSPFSIAFASVMATQATRNLEESSNISTNMDSLLNESSMSVNLNESANASESGINSSILNSQSANTSSSSSNSNRRSISELIAQKRREMIKQASEIKNKKRKRRRPLTISSSESSDDESNSSSNNRRKKRATENEGHSEGSHPNVLSAQRQMVQLQLKRLQQLRSNVLQSDSDNSDDEVVINKSALDNSKTKREPVVCEEIPKLKVDKMKNDFLQSVAEIPSSNKVSCAKGKDGGEIGPYLHEADFNNQPSTSQGGNSHSHHNNHVSSSSHGASHLPTNNTHQTSCEKKGSSTSSTTNSQASAETSSQSNWTEFKRFKNRAKHSRRQYRQHSQSDHGENDD